MFDSVTISGLTAQLNTLNLIAAGPNDLWTTKWLTPIWFLGVGLAFGLLAIGLFILLTRVLSNVPVWEQLSRSVAVMSLLPFSPLESLAASLLLYLPR